MGININVAQLNFILDISFLLVPHTVQLQDPPDGFVVVAVHLATLNGFDNGFLYVTAILIFELTGIGYPE